MERPPSIVMFERLYLGSLVLGIINAIVFWNAMMEQTLSNPQLAGNPMASSLPMFTIGGLVFGALITLLLWYLTARRASVVAKWFVVVFTALGAIAAIFKLLALVTGRAGNVPMTVIGLVVTALSIAAAVYLFKPDAKAWFGESTDPTEPLA